MATFQLALTAEERVFLVSLLETTQKDTRIEEHRTRARTTASTSSTKGT